MGNTEGPMLQAEQAISQELEGFQRRASAMWRGREKEAVIALVRALDSVAIVNMHDRNAGRPLSANRENSRMSSLFGAAPALRPFLAAVKDQPGGVPWGPSASEVTKFAYAYLDCCGKLAHLRRMASLERYGLARTSWTSTGLVIELERSAPELALQFATRSRRVRRSEPLPGGEAPERRWRRVHRRMLSYVDSADGWFIRYDNDMRIVSEYRRVASDYGADFLEGEALSPDVHIGDRSFGEWRTACDHALGRVLCHIDFAHLLRQKCPTIALGDVSTIFARRDDVAAVWMQAGLAAERVAATMGALTLDIDGLDEWERAHDFPCPYYIDLGRDFVLLPCFGALSNPYFALFRHLRSTYRRDWDRGVDRREDVFRRDLAEAFAEPRFQVPAHGYRLRRPDGSVLTDIDAVILDRYKGRLALVQLKWHDVFGHSLAERESRRRNLLQANEWVDRVSTWIGGRDSRAVADELGLQGATSSAPPALFVIARYTARFSGERNQDPRAAWLGWSEILHGLESGAEADPLADIPRLVAEMQESFDRRKDFVFEYRFPGLSVSLRNWA
ncbi:MAG: hypothetical protein IIZ92_13430 [Aquincola sp.]|uniref:hypothetical protein n=1 Tax=uncultured Aquincola sp. TaxID=886556 RepID=UPI0032B1287D|nr:hypothetical protein [Aquincola sp.]|tara:strand:- start:651 stop:2333 length:1683 start_codon:yes stop_codon:yes gene_type:complete